MESYDSVLTLPFATRQKSRFRAVLNDGREVGVFLDRGGVLRAGDYLTGPDKQIVRIEAKPETVSTVTVSDGVSLVHAAYHLGNRHVPLQIGDGWLRYLEDHVLDDMCRRLGLVIQHELAPFEPEQGAYSGHHHE